MAKTTTTDPQCALTRRLTRPASAALPCKRTHSRASVRGALEQSCARKLYRAASLTVRDLRGLRGRAPHCGVRCASHHDVLNVGDSLD